MKHRSLAALLLALVASASPTARAGKQKVRHKNVVELPSETRRASVEGIGSLTDVTPIEGGWILAGTTGIARLDSALAVSWALPLPEAGFRNLAVDASGIAFTAYSDAGREKVDGMKGVMGKMAPDRFLYSGATIGLLSLEGELRWQQPVEGDLAISPPTLTHGHAIATTNSSVVLASRENGSLRIEDFEKRDQKDAKVAGAVLGLGGPFGKLLGSDPETLRLLGEITKSSNRPVTPVALGDHVFASVGWINAQLSSTGEIEWVSPLLKGRTGQGTAAPAALGDVVVFAGTAGMPGMKDRVLALAPRDGKDPKVAWSRAVMNQVKGLDTGTTTSWTLFGITDIDAHQDGAVVAGEVCVRRLDAKGKVKWEAWNKKGGLYANNARSLDFSAPAPRRNSHGQLVIGHGDAVYASSVLGESDVVTVLDWKSGKYIETWNLGGRLLDMAETEGALALLTPEALLVVPR